MKFTCKYKRCCTLWMSQSLSKNAEKTTSGIKFQEKKEYFKGQKRKTAVGG